jgi:AbrB family looped-hinge helix DNA binding protein
MSMLATTKLSSKGQIVIPEDIRNKMGFHTGDQFIVVAEKDVVILKTIHQPALDEFKELVLEARKAAKKAGITKDSVKEAIKEARKM